MSLSDWAVRNIRPIVFVTLVLCLTGAWFYTTFPVSILPDVTFPRVVTIAEAGDRPARSIEISITRPIEEALATIPGIKRIRSQTKRGSTEISADFAAGTDILVAEQMVNAKVNEVRPELPPETHTEVERMNPTVFPVLGLTLNSKSLTQTELWSLATYSIRPRLSRVDGVSRVEIQGGRTPEIQVLVKTAALAGFGISPSDVVQAISDANQIHTVGRINQEFKQFQIVVTGETTSPEAIGEIVIAQRGGLPIRVKQVADVQLASADKTTIVSANGSESVLMNVIRQPSANTVAMVGAVDKELASLQKSLPSDVTITPFYDQSTLIKDAVGSVRDAVLIGAFLSIFVLLAFLKDIRATLLTSAIIPSTLLVTFILMRLAGLTLNLITLGALAVGIGLIIDDAIVVVEAVFRHLAGADTIQEAVKVASTQIAAPMISSTITTVVVFLPLAFLTGVAGAFFSALALTLTFALMVSLALALFVSPSLCAAFLKKSDSIHEGGRLYHAILRGYRKLLSGILRHRLVVVPIIGLTLLGTWLIANRLETGFMPEMDEGSFVLDYLSPPGTSLEESDRLLKQVDGILKSTPEVATFSRRTGTELGFAITETNRGDYAVMLKTDRHRTIDEVISEVRDKVHDAAPGLDVEFVQVLQDLIGDLAGNPDPLEVKLFGENKAEVEGIASDLADRLGKVKGIVDVKTGAVESGPEMLLTIDPGEVGRRGLTTQAVTDQVNASLFGTVATQVLRGDRQVPVRVRLPDSERTTIADVERLGIQTPNGRVQLKDLAKVSFVAGTTQSSREDQRRLVAVTGRMADGVDLGTGVAKVREALAQTHLPPGVTAVIAGQFQSQQESFQNLAQVLGAAVLLVFVVMLFQFRSFTAPSVILILMPLALFGAVVALMITGTALNVSSFMGVIMLAGIVVKNGILLLDRAQHGVEEGFSVEQAVLDAGEVRLRPILMTTMTAILGLLPLAFGLGAGAEMQKPLAVAVVGGLTFSTILTLVIGPALFALFCKGVRGQ